MNWPHMIIQVFGDVAIGLRGETEKKKPFAKPMKVQRPTYIPAEIHVETVGRDFLHVTSQSHYIKQVSKQKNENIPDHWESAEDSDNHRNRHHADNVRNWVWQHR